MNRSAHVSELLITLPEESMKGLTYKNPNLSEATDQTKLNTKCDSDPVDNM